ncbi:MAG: DUF6498-containing protein [Candidatus Marsarchaeota archaeon]|nr:DUF6498-containing protein [Candidatus Marsarchaeota archaeon]
MKLAFAFSILILLIANLALLSAGMSGQWDMSQYLLIYWCESAIIGFFTLLKLWLSRAKKPMPFQVRAGGTTKDIDGASAAGRLALMGFFSLHFGLFMFVHLVFLLAFLGASLDVLPAVLWGAAVLFASHALSFFFHFLRGGERESMPAEQIFFSPYPRVIFMHLVVIGGALLSFWPPLVVLVKICADLWGHWMSHTWSPKQK